jgi:AraC-like DNA-binding protein
VTTNLGSFLYPSHVGILNHSEYKPDNHAVRIDQLCEWIHRHVHSNIGWEDLIRESGYSHRDLINLFQLHKKTLPMLYIRQCREKSKLDEASDAIEVPRHLKH